LRNNSLRVRRWASPEQHVSWDSCRWILMSRFLREESKEMRLDQEQGWEVICFRTYTHSEAHKY
jgi:hypothetical protein